MFRKVKYFFINVKKWFPVLVEDRPYDYIYIYEVIKRKLELMLELFSSEDASSLYVLQTVYEINYCIYLLDRLIADDYMVPEASDYYLLKVNCYIEGKDNGYVEANPEIVKQWFKEEEDARNKDRKELFNRLEKHIEGWWD